MKKRLNYTLINKAARKKFIKTEILQLVNKVVRKNTKTNKKVVVAS